MAFKSISAILTDKTADAALLSAAQSVAHQNDAHLDLFCMGVDPARYEPMPSAGVTILMEEGAVEAQEQAAAIEAWAKNAIMAGQSKVGMERVVAPQLALDTIVARKARYSDLVVAALPYGKGKSPVHVTTLEALLFGTNAPVLVVPDNAPVGPFKHVIVAWNESSEAFNAVRAALPLLVTAERVEIVMVDPPSHSPERSEPGGALCLMLARHGVRAEVLILSRSLPRVSDVILRQVREQGADLLVMGAYGHSRFREAVLGGATRDLLEMADVPLLMAH